MGGDTRLALDEGLDSIARDGRHLGEVVGLDVLHLVGLNATTQHFHLIERMLILEQLHL